jgi:cytochrome P450
MAKYFSRPSIMQLEPVIFKQLEYFCDKLLRVEKGANLDITTAYSCFTSDIISACCFGEPFGFLTQSGWEPNWRRLTHSFLNTIFILRFFPILHNLIFVGKILALRGWLGSDIKTVLHTLYVRIPRLIARASKNTASGPHQKPLFTDILDSDALPESEKSLSRLSAESMALLSAGTETTAWTLSVITFYMLSQPKILSRLAQDLNQTSPEQRTWLSLEKLPYLSGVVLEGLRLSYGISSRTPRIATQEELVFKGKVISKGWAIGMSSAIMHHNEDIFPNSDLFLPERWIDGCGNKRKDLEKYLLCFSRGSRQCLGIK